MTLRRFLIRMIGLCMTPLILLAIFLAVSSVLNKQAERNTEAANLAKSFATTIDQNLQARISALHILAESALVDDTSRWKDLYREAQGFYQGFGSHVIFADPEMRMLFNTRAPFGSKLPRLPRPKGHAAVPTVMRTGKPAVGDRFPGPIAKEPLVAIAVPVLREKKISFLMLTLFETRQFQDRLDHLDLPPGWAITLIDGNNEVIARRAPPGLNSATDVDAAGRFLVKSAVSPWSVALEIPRSTYRKPLINAVSILAIAILGVTLISFLGGILASHRLGNDVKSLVETPAPGTPPPAISEIAAVRQLLVDSAEKRQRSDNDLKESEERYRLFFRHSIDAVLLTTPDGKILQANPEACRIFGHTEEEIRQVDRDGVVDTTDPRLGPALEERERTGRFKGELKFRRKDGTSFPGEISSAVFRDSDGNHRTSMIIRDMTEQRQTEAARVASESRFRRFLEMAPLPVCHVDKNGVITFRNVRFIEMFGYTHDVVPTLAEWWQCAYPDPDYRRWVIDTWDAALKRAADKGTDIEPLEYKVTCKNGEQRIVETSGITMDEDFFATFIDLTDRKRAEAEVLKDRDFSDTVIDSLPGIFYMYTEQRRFLRWNKNFERLSGYTGAEIARMNPLDFFAGPEKNVLDEKIKEVFTRGAAEVEADFLAKDGARTPCYFTGLTLKIDGQRNLIGVGIDITDRKRAEEELGKYRDHLEDLIRERTKDLAEANLRLQELDRLKSLFIASMSHELRTPLNSIIGFTGIILMGMSGPISEIQRKQLGMVKNSATHLLALINDVIDVSKIEAGKTELTIEAFELSALALEVKESFAVAASDKGLNLEWKTDGTAEVTSDRRRVRQILVNLVGNAVKFTETGGVAIDVKVAESGTFGADSAPDGGAGAEGTFPAIAKGDIQVTVRDTGIGVHREDMERLFHAFSRIHIQDRPVVEGTGLGLYLSQKIAALLGGEITAESEPGRGSAFTLSLPRKHREEKA